MMLRGTKLIIRWLRSAKAEKKVKNTKKLSFRKVAIYIKYQFLLKLRLDKALWKLFTNSTLSLIVLQCILKAPYKIRLGGIVSLRWFYFLSHRLFFFYKQPEKSLYVARLIKLFFKGQLANHSSQDAHIYADVCIQAGDPQRLCREYKNIKNLHCHNLSYLVGYAFLLCGEFIKAQKHILNALKVDSSNIEILRLAGIIHVLLGNHSEGEKLFEKRILMNKCLLVPHQNVAARYEKYLLPGPTLDELEESGSLQIYDQLNFMGEQLILYGKLAASMRAYKEALLHQKKLKETVQLPEDILHQLHSHPKFKIGKPIAILPIEWITQIGHIALLDIFLKIEQLERKRNCNYILLAPRSMVPNHHYLQYWKPCFCVIEEDSLVHALTPYQRHLGEGFIPYLHENNEIEPWTRVGARVQCKWHQQGLPPQLSLSSEDKIFGQKVLQEMGVPSDAWFVALHIREGSYHNEMKGGSGDHRNAEIHSYLAAVEEIVARGGWVIRMGDAKMTPLPKMKHVIDYAVSVHKSARMDIFLVASAYLFIGTTSGLTTTALSFDTPALLVNVISNDWQLWTNKTHFLPKTIYDYRTKRTFTMAELYLSESRDLLIKKELVHKKKWKIIDNSSEDILEGLRYKLDVLEKKDRLSATQEKLVEAYNKDMAKEPYMFGAAHIVPNFLERHPYLISRIGS